MKKNFLGLFLMLFLFVSCTQNQKLDNTNFLNYSETKKNKNKIIYVATWCPACQKMIENLIKNNEKNTILVFYPYDENGEKDLEGILKYISTKGIKNKFFIDEKLEIKHKFNIKSVPQNIEF